MAPQKEEDGLLKIGEIVLYNGLNLLSDLMTNLKVVSKVIRNTHSGHFGP